MIEEKKTGFEDISDDDFMESVSTKSNPVVEDKKRVSIGREFQDKLAKGLASDIKKKEARGEAVDPMHKNWSDAERGYAIGIGFRKQYPKRPEYINNDFINEHAGDYLKESQETEKGNVGEQFATFYEPLYQKALEKNPGIDRETFYSWMQPFLRS